MGFYVFGIAEQQHQLRVAHVWGLSDCDGFMNESGETRYFGGCVIQLSFAGKVLLTMKDDQCGWNTHIIVSVKRWSLLGLSKLVILV